VKRCPWATCRSRVEKERLASDALTTPGWRDEPVPAKNVGVVDLTALRAGAVPQAQPGAQVAAGQPGIRSRDQQDDIGIRACLAAGPGAKQANLRSRYGGSLQLDLGLLVQEPESSPVAADPAKGALECKGIHLTRSRGQLQRRSGELTVARRPSMTC